MAISATYDANSSGVMSYVFVIGSGKPAFGFTTKGRLVHLESSPIIGKSSFGPREQFKPMAETPRPFNVIAIDGISQPVNVLLFSSKVIVTIIGLSEFSLAARTAALTS